VAVVHLERACRHFETVDAREVARTRTYLATALRKPPKSGRLTAPPSMPRFAPANKEARSDDEEADGEPRRVGVARGGGGMGEKRQDARGIRVVARAGRRDAELVDRQDSAA